MFDLKRSSAADDRKTLDYEAIFGNDSGEDEAPEVLASYFVEQHSFKRAYDKNRKLEIVKGRKGMGKSALLAHLKYRLTDESNPLDKNAIVVKVTGNDLIGLADFSGSDSTQLENRWKQVICKRISLELASQMGFAMSDDSMSLIEAAEIEGIKGRNLVSGLMARLNPVLDNAAKALTQGVISLKTANPTDPKNLAYENILKRLQKSSETTVWLLVDDIDAKYIDTLEQQARIGAFFSALRSLAFTVEGLRVRATVRTDVWTNIRCMEDQDKLRQYITDITWSDDHLRGIFAKKILSHLQRDGAAIYDSWDEQKDYSRIINQVFKGHFKIGHEKNSDPMTVAMMLAGKRPRWMGQLCKLAGAAAGDFLIEHRHFDHVMKVFGQEKITDLIKEHHHQFAELQKVIDAFRISEKTNSKHKLLRLLDRGFVSKMNIGDMPSVNGYPYKSLDQIAELLYEIDFIVGEKSGKQTGFQHDPTLFKSELNSQNKVPWMVNLSYRKFLEIQ
jgi:hypothetical protein